MTDRQEVNLYLPRLRPSVDYFAPTMVARAVGVFLMILVAMALFDAYQNYALVALIEEQQQAMAERQTQLDDVKKRVPKSQGAHLERTIATMRSQVKRRQAISRLIDGQSIGNTQGFSRQLLALAEYSNDKLSLKGFQLQAGGKRIVLHGHARVAEAVPHYIELLRSSESFNDSVFGPLKIARANSGHSLNFSLNEAEALINE